MTNQHSLLEIHNSLWYLIGTPTAPDRMLSAHTYSTLTTRTSTGTDITTSTQVVTTFKQLSNKDTCAVFGAPSLPERYQKTKNLIVFLMSTLVYLCWLQDEAIPTLVQTFFSVRNYFDILTTISNFHFDNCISLKKMAFLFLMCLKTLKRG